MRTLPVFLVLGLFGLALPLAHAAPEPLGLSHLETGTLLPGTSVEYRIGMSTDSPADAGEFFFLSASVEGDAATRVSFELRIEAGPVLANWSWVVDGAVHVQYTELDDVEQFYLLTVSSHVSDPGPVDYWFQYDISCDCEEKAIALEGGVIVFHKDIRYEEVAHINFELDHELDFDLWVAIPEEHPRTFPDGWEVLEEGHREGVRLTLTYNNEEYVGPLYFFIQSNTGTATIEPLYVLPPQTTAVMWLAAIWIGLALIFFGGLWLLSRRPDRSEPGSGEQE